MPCYNQTRILIPRKIIESQSAVISNIEALAHLRSVDARYAKHPDYVAPSTSRKDRKAAFSKDKSALDGGRLRGLRSAVHDGISYLSTTPTLPGASDPTGARPDPPLEAVTTIIEALGKWSTLTKAEKLMIVNLRPVDTDALEVLVEEADARLSEDEKQEIVDIVRKAFEDGAKQKFDGKG